MALNVKKLETDEFGIKVYFSWTRRIQNMSKNHNLYLHQSKITLPGSLWDTLYIKLDSRKKNMTFLTLYEKEKYNLNTCESACLPVLRIFQEQFMIV